MAASAMQLPPTALLLAAELKIAALIAALFLPVSFSLAVILIAALIADLAAATGVALPETLVVQAHRWRYALSGAAARTMLWDEGSRLGVSGDWLIGPRIESAWASGRALAAAMTA